MSVSALRLVLNRARIAIAVEGSSLMHALLMMPERAALLTIQPPQRFNNVLKGYADALGLRYAFTVADVARDGFHLPFSRLLGALHFTLDHLD